MCTVMLQLQIVPALFARRNQDIISEIPLPRSKVLPAECSAVSEVSFFLSHTFCG